MSSDPISISHGASEPIKAAPEDCGVVGGTEFTGSGADANSIE